MQISELQEETQDLDWFALDAEGAVGHFATGGCGVLPWSITSSLEDLKKVAEYFRKRTAPITSPVVSQTLDSHIALRDEVAKARYLQDFIAMASHGLFSFDYLRIGKRPTGYFQVAKPSIPLQTTVLPQEIRQILDRTVLKGVCFRTSSEISAEAAINC